MRSDLKHQDFADCGATIEFIRMVDSAFDIMNIRSPFGKYLKEPLRLSNKVINFISLNII